MEFVIVRFRESRKVLIDGDEAGFTNETIRVSQGFHTFSLDGPADFSPPDQSINISNTTAISPREVNFA